MRRHASAALALVALLLGCPGEPDDDDTTGDDDAADDDSADDDTGDDDTTGAEGPCDGGTWGFITDPQDALHVREDGSDAGDGSMSSPLATVEAALALSRQKAGAKRIAIGPGTYSVSVELRDDPDPVISDTGLQIEGCSPEEVTLEGAGADLPVVKIGEASGVHLAGVTLQGGKRGLWAWQGAQLTIDTVHVRDSALVGIIFEGTDTLVELQDVEVLDPVPAANLVNDVVGYGIGVRLATVTMTGGGVWNAYRVGILGETANLTLHGVTVQDTEQDAVGQFGRGVHLENLSVATLEGCSLTGNADAGLFSMRSLQLGLEDVTVDATAASGLPQGKETSGDGIVANKGGGNEDPANFVTSISGCEVHGSARAGVLVDGVTATLDGNTAGADNGLVQQGTSIFAQGDAVVSGADAYVELVQPIPLNLTSIGLDEIVP